jgi:N-acetylglutamate synthase-like GNAT family acetyltransferase
MGAKREKMAAHTKQVRLRKAKIGDIDALSKLLHQYDLFEHDLDKRVEVESVKKYKKDLHEMFENKTDIFIVAEDKSDVVGFMSYSIYRKGKITVGILSDTFVVDSYRGKGIGNNLFNYVMNEFKKRDCKFIKSGVRVKNKKAQKFWQKRGFKINFSSIVDYGMRKEL